MKQHATFKPLIEGIPGQRFIESFIVSCRPWSEKRGSLFMPKSYEYNVYEEFPIFSEATDDFQKIIRRAPQIDAMICLYLNISAKFSDSVHIFVEIKGTRRDLLRAVENPVYFEKYKNASDYLFLAVPSKLVTIALNRVSDPTVGIFNIETGRILRIPARQKLSIRRRQRNFETMITYCRYLYQNVRNAFPATIVSDIKETELEKFRRDICNNTQKMRPEARLALLNKIFSST